MSQKGSVHLFLIFLFGLILGGIVVWGVSKINFKNAPLVSSPPKTADSAPTPKRQNIEVIKGTFDPGYTESLLQNNLKGVSGTGFNTIYIYLNYEYDQEGSLKLASPFGKGDFSPKAPDEYTGLIKLAKQNNLGVHLTLEFGGGHNKPLGVPQDKFLEDVRREATNWAAIAEENQVESFAPASEIDFHINKEYFGNDPARRGEVVKIVNEFHADVLPEIKKVFAGKTVYQHASYDHSTIDATGYDLIGVDFGPAGRDLDQFRSDVKGWFKTVSETAKNSHTDWFVSEFGVTFKKLEMGQREGGEVLKTNSGESYDDLQDEFYKVATEEYLNFSGDEKPKGFGIFSYLHPIAKVYERPAEKVLKDFFSKI